jgi:hypothetical protein
MTKNIIRLYDEPLERQYTNYFLCKDTEGNHYVIADARCIGHDYMVDKFSIPRSEIMGGGIIKTYKKNDIVWIQFGGHGSVYGTADHAKAVEVAKKDVYKYVREKWSLQNQNCRVYAEKKK